MYFTARVTFTDIRTTSEAINESITEPEPSPHTTDSTEDSCSMDKEDTSMALSQTSGIGRSEMLKDDSFVLGRATVLLSCIVYLSIQTVMSVLSVYKVQPV